jgi:hypothetical protein
MQIDLGGSVRSYRRLVRPLMLPFGGQADNYDARSCIDFDCPCQRDYRPRCVLPRLLYRRMHDMDGLRG